MSLDIEKFLTPRLRMVIDLVPEGKNIADIGTDHGYIPIYLAKKRNFDNIIASDINKGPLNRADENIKLFGVESIVGTRLSDGLKAFREGEIDTVIIAGMGGELISTILESKVAEGINAFVLQPMVSHYELRTYLHKKGYIIKDEELCREENKFYVAILATKGKEDIWTHAEYQIGKRLIEKKHPLLKEYIKYRLHEVETILKGLKNATNAAKQTEYYLSLETSYNNLIKECESW